MIRRIWSDLKSFREVSFAEHMNVVLADTAEDSEETESTNGLGKTTLIRIVQFCLGADFAREKILNHPDLANVTFGMDFVLRGTPVTVSRNTSSAKLVSITQSFLAELPVEIVSVKNELATISVDDWKIVLSDKFFPDSRIQPNDHTKHSPTFRDLALYLIRLSKAAYADPQVAYQGQKGASKRLCTSFLLGLNWTLQRRLQANLSARSQVRDALEAVKMVDETSNSRSIGDLEADRVALESALNVKKKEADTFNVREDYRQLEQSLNDLDRQIHTLINDNHADKRLQEYYQQSAAEIPEASADRPVTLLRDAGAIFREEALRRIEDVALFHAEVYRNRKHFLKAEINRLGAAIASRTSQIDDKSRDKQRVLSILRTSGALESLIDLQRTVTELNAQYEVLKSRIDEQKRFDRRKDELSATISQERVLLKSDLDDRRVSVDEVRALFAEYTQILYGRPGRLGVDVGSEGYSFSFTIDRAGSDGVDQMVVFCFDLTIASIWAKRGAGFPTLIHDSTLFADVDPRQYALALKLAAERSEKYGFQYICCLNAGALPAEHFGEFSLEPFIKLRLTDEGPQGRLLGVKLPPREQRAA